MWWERTGLQLCWKTPQNYLKESIRSLYNYFVRIHLQSIKTEKWSPREFRIITTEKWGGGRDGCLTPHIQFNFVVSWSQLHVCTEVAYNFSTHVSFKKWDNRVFSTSWAQAELLAYLELVAATSYLTLPGNRTYSEKLTFSPLPIKPIMTEKWMPVFNVMV